jgi:cell division protein FtsB
MGCGKSVDREAELQKLIAKQKQQIADLTRANAAIKQSVESLRSTPSSALQAQVLLLESKLTALSEKALLRHASTLSRDEDTPNRHPVSQPKKPARLLYDKGVWKDPQVKEMLERRRKMLIKGNPDLGHS